MCDAYASNCDKCPFASYECARTPKHRLYFTDKQVEAIVATWAAKNPEPQYPTWGEYITRIMLEDITHRNDSTPQTRGQWMNKTLIPADIAQKLGIKPKEDV